MKPFLVITLLFVQLACGTTDQGGLSAPLDTSPDNQADAAPAESMETVLCGCDDSTNLDDSVVAQCLQEHLALCAQASGGYWTDFGTNFVYIPGDQAAAPSCYFEIYIEEEGFRQKFQCELSPEAVLQEEQLIDPYWPLEPNNATCVLIDSCNGFDPDCESLGPSCLSPH